MRQVYHAVRRPAQQHLLHDDAEGVDIGRRGPPLHERLVS